MKKAILLLSMCSIAFTSKAITQDQTTTSSDSIQTEETPKPPTLHEQTNSILSNIAGNTSSIEYYKLYPTTNMWTFIKLDRRNGRLWQVQFDVSGSDRFEVEINSSDLRYYSQDNDTPRFELYPTQNMYNFLLLDQETGRVWQAQWSTKGSDYRFVTRIY